MENKVHGTLKKVYISMVTLWGAMIIHYFIWTVRIKFNGSYCRNEKKCVKLELISTTKLANETVRFSKQTIYQYEIDNGLYVKYLDCPSRKKISNRNVKEIVTTIQNKVYYLAGESLYYYTEETGEVEVMSYFEWNFNYKNMIFILEEK